MNESENVFLKKLPDGKEIESFFSSIYKTFETMLNIDQLDNKIINLSEKKKEQNKEQNDYSYINTVVQDTIADIFTSIISKLFTAVNRHIRPPYSNELNSNISEVFENCQKLQKKIFENNDKENNLTGILVFGILASKIIRFQKQIICSENYIPDESGYIKWYYGNYNSIIDTINFEYDDEIYWMDSAITWIGYNKEEIVVIIIESSSNTSLNLNILRAYIKSISSFVYVNEVKQYIIITKSKPSDIYIENNLIDTKNIIFVE